MTATPRRSTRSLVFATLAVLCAAQPGRSQDLSLANVTYRQFDGGPGVGADWEFAAGDTVFLSFRIAGFRTEEKNEQEFLRINYQIETFDPEGVRVIEDVSDSIQAEMTYEDRKSEWMPLVNYEVPLPQSAPSGTYQTVVEIHGEVSGRSTVEEIPFRVRGRDVEPSDSLVIRNLHFYRSQTSIASLSDPAYRPGDTVWARFDMTGYELGEGNRFHINYGLKVLRESGEILFDQEIAADERRETFYPERNIAGSFGLPLTEDLPEGDYTIILTIRDLLGNQTYQAEEIFHVD